MSRLYAESFSVAVYLSRTIFISFWYICICVMISMKSFTIGNFVEINPNREINPKRA
jgi:hypothetical protein